jgi:hypothetical protein
MPDLAFVLERGKHVRPPKQLDVGWCGVGAYFLDQILETNHRGWCLIRKATFGRELRPIIEGWIGTGQGSVDCTRPQITAKP